jgi:serine/threonine-protein kinase
LALPPGTRLGVYEVTAQIGEGGMGQVFRATDTKLKRQVAIKILPPSFAADHDRLARFQREAEVLASLNHPHIAAIYGLEESGGVSALVMELVEGEDLSQRISRGAIPIDEALPIAQQIAEALEAAHEQGIIHRDLKPVNIKLRIDGTVKVLDFGLAKALETKAASATAEPTITSPAMTQAGMILGTAAYMSPEQAKGKAVDKRADIWAFGVVLYEMLTGRRLFDAEGMSETLAAVLTRDVSLASMPSSIPARLRALLRDCLIRDPKQRLRDIGEARRVLDKMIAGAPDDAVTTTVATARVPSRALPWVVAAVSVVALGIALWVPRRSETTVDRPLVRLDVDVGADATFPSANVIQGSSIAISPDGTRLAYVAGTPPRLFTRRLDQPTAGELPGTQGASSPFFSHDGQWIGFLTSGKLNKIAADGGAVVQVGEAVVSVFAGASWAEDGSIIASEPFGKGLLQFPAAGGTPITVAPVASGEAALVVPHFLPGGQAILAAACPLGSGDNCNIEVVTPADGRRKILARGGNAPHYLPSSDTTGHLVYVNKATLFAIPFDLAALETRGEAVPVLNDVAFATLSGAGLFDVSRSGTLIYRRSPGDAAAMTTVQWVYPSDGSTGKRERVRATAARYSDPPRISPDGKRIALVIQEGANSDLWVYEPQRDAITRLTFGGTNWSAVWSPDGQYVVFAKLNGGMFYARADGASPPQALTESKTNQAPWSFMPDGKRLTYFEMFGRPQIWTVPVEDQGGQLKAGTPELFLKSNFADFEPSFSPDGRWLAYGSNESGRNEVYVRAFPPPSSGQGGKWQVSNNGGGDPQWSRTGHELVYLSGNQLMSVSYSVNGNSFVAERPRVWIAAVGGTEWGLAPDGKRVAVVIPEATAQASQQEHVIVMLLNFADELRRRVPLGK